MGKGLEMLGRGTMILLTTAACVGESSSGPESDSAAKAADAIMGFVVHTEDARGIPVGVRGYLDPHDLSKTENGWYPEGARVPFVCYEIGRLGIDRDVQGPDPVQWSVWYQVHGGHNGRQQWLPQPYIQTEAPLPRCP